MMLKHSSHHTNKSHKENRSSMYLIESRANKVSYNNVLMRCCTYKSTKLCKCSWKMKRSKRNNLISQLENLLDMLMTLLVCRIRENNSIQVEEHLLILLTPSLLYL